jgi:hypothetical protein
VIHLPERGGNWFPAKPLTPKPDAPAAAKQRPKTTTHSNTAQKASEVALRDHAGQAAPLRLAFFLAVIRKPKLSTLR